MRIAGWALVVLGAVMASPALAMLLIGTIEGWGSDPYRVVRIICFAVAAVGACVSGIGGLMAWVGRPEKR
jgi:hypothetical protein